jgi:hypothetical protein
MQFNEKCSLDMEAEYALPEQRPFACLKILANPAMS